MPSLFNCMAAVCGRVLARTGRGRARTLIPRTMPPSLQRMLRTNGLPLTLLCCVAAAALLAWLTARREGASERTPTACSRAMGEVFAGDAASAPDSVLLDRLMVHAGQCEGDAEFVDQARRLMLILQRPADARALLERADRRHALAPDELAAQLAMVDLGEAELARQDGDLARAGELHARAVAAAARLRDRWPEWSMPYRILEDAARDDVGATDTTGGVSSSFQLESAMQHRMLTGAFVREIGTPQAVASAFVIGLLGALALAAVVSAMVTMREMTRMPTSAIAAAPAGYVELVGTLHLSPGADAVLGPLTHASAVWYAMETNFGNKGSKTWRERSGQSFLIRDASGEAMIDPHDMTVRTRHSTTRYGGSAGLTSSRRTSERLLKEGDTAYVLGELRFSADVGGAHARSVGIAADGRRLLVSNLSEAELMRRERIQLWLGAAVSAASAMLLAWSYVQRYRVAGIPGVLR